MSIAYETVTGFFVQDNTKFVELPAHFGLIDDSSTRWSTFSKRIDHLNAIADPGTCYKVLFLGRHGEGFHNVGQAKHGTKAWDDYWSKLNGDGELVWGPDPELTATGEGQGRMAHAAWATELPFGIPLPENLYCSPLTRAIRTNILTFEGLIDAVGPKTVVLENLREENGVHTCDKRRTLTYIKDAFPQLAVEDGFTEDDELWKPHVRETHAELDTRAKAMLDNVFGHSKGQCISITAHGGIIGAILRVVGHPNHQLSLPTGVRGYTSRCQGSGQQEVAGETALSQAHPTPP
ncbi:phosphoglycerate mutase-like protein [Leucogyrophana mollusca]|uniref:Phosphoglycerate mutase-like protein n=1 Tax=Leucogyrophana mollusca TaxID=85980 RepID=A0ACB8B0D3_9AGAM|nr:phosphoglycerate mutase-like protein [Leucogyrophana mollusca]